MGTRRNKEEIQEDRVQPTYYIFTFILEDSAALVGYNNKYP